MKRTRSAACISSARAAARSSTILRFQINPQWFTVQAARSQVGSGNLDLGSHLQRRQLAAVWLLALSPNSSRPPMLPRVPRIIASTVTRITSTLVRRIPPIIGLPAMLFQGGLSMAARKLMAEDRRPRRRLADLRQRLMAERQARLSASAAIFSSTKAPITLPPTPKDRCGFGRHRFVLHWRHEPRPDQRRQFPAASCKTRGTARSFKMTGASLPNSPSTSDYATN